MLYILCEKAKTREIKQDYFTKGIEKTEEIWYAIKKDHAILSIKKGMF